MYVAIDIAVFGLLVIAFLCRESTRHGDKQASFWAGYDEGFENGREIGRDDGYEEGAEETASDYYDGR